MKILFLASSLLHPRVVSGLVVIHNRIRFLAERGHEVGLAAFHEPGADNAAHEILPLLREMELVPVPRRASPLRLLLRFLFNPVPLPFAPLHSERMRQVVGTLVERTRYDVVVAEFTAMGQYFLRNVHLPAVRRVVSCHTCYTTALRDALRLRAWTRDELRIRAHLKNLQRYEFAVYRSADRILTLTPEDKLDLLNTAPDLPITVVPAGVDVAKFRPPDVPPAEDVLMLTGFYGDEVNRDAALWFARTTWPALRARNPGLRLHIVGSSPPHEVRDLGRRDPRIVVTGEVPDIAEALRQARVYVCPVRMGRGLRFKVLEAMACGVPVVSTTLGAEGIPAQSGADIFLADTPHTMAESINLLLRDEAMRAAMATRARELVVFRYSWERCTDLLENALGSVAGMSTSTSSARVPPPSS